MSKAIVKQNRVSVNSPVCAIRSIEWKKGTSRFTYVFDLDENGEYIRDGWKAKHMSNVRYTVYIPSVIQGEYPVIGEYAANYLYQLAYKFVGRALLTNYQKSGHPALWTMYTACKRQTADLFNSSMFQEIETEMHIQTRRYDKHFHKFFELEEPQKNQRVIYDTAKEVAYHYTDAEPKTVYSADVYADIEDMASAAHEMLLVLVRAGQITNFSDVQLHKSAIYKAVNREIVYSRTIQAQMSDNVRIFDENGLEKIVSAQYYDDHSKINVPAIIDTLARVIKANTRREFNTDSAIHAFMLSLDGYTQREIAIEIGVGLTQVNRWISTVKTIIDTPAFHEQLHEMI